MNTMDCLQQWTVSLVLPGLTEPLDPLGQAIGIHLYRMMATDAPVQPLQIAEAELGWLAANADGLTLTLDDGFGFARTRNEWVFAPALADAA